MEQENIKSIIDQHEYDRLGQPEGYLLIVCPDCGGSGTERRICVNRTVVITSCTFCLGYGNVRALVD